METADPQKRSFHLPLTLTKGDISKSLEGGHFYFPLTRTPAVLTKSGLFYILAFINQSGRCEERCEPCPSEARRAKGGPRTAPSAVKKDYETPNSSRASHSRSSLWPSGFPLASQNGALHLRRSIGHPCHQP